MALTEPEVEVSGEAEPAAVHGSGKIAGRSRDYRRAHEQQRRSAMPPRPSSFDTPPGALRAWRQPIRCGLVALAAIGSLAGAVEAGTLMVDFRQPRTLYQASDEGISKSVDGGATWTLQNTGFPASDRRSMYVTALVMDPQDSRTLYAGTQDLGIFKTTDG